MSDCPIRKRFVEFCRLLYDRELVAGIGGNVAAKHGDAVLVTPTNRSLRGLTPEDVVAVDAAGAALGPGRPSKEIGMHLAVLRAHPSANVVVHAHGSYLIAASCMLEPGDDSLPPLTPGYTCFAYPMPMLPFALPGSTQLVKSVAGAIEGRRAVLLQNHGLVVWGEDFDEALDITEEIEESAQVFVLSAGKARPIPEGMRAGIV